MYATINVYTQKIAVVEPTGPINAANAAAFGDELNLAVNSASKSPMLVDLQKVDFIDSAGLMVLVNALSRTQQANRRFGLCSVCPAIQMIFELTQLDRVFEIYENREAFEAAMLELSK